MSYIQMCVYLYMSTFAYFVVSDVMHVYLYMFTFAYEYCMHLKHGCANLYMYIGDLMHTCIHGASDAMYR